MSTSRPAPIVVSNRFPGAVKPSDSERLSALFYGLPGNGKTTLAGTADDDDRMRPVFFVDVEGGLMSISQREDVDSTRITTYRDLEKVDKYFKAHPNHPYKTVVVDSITALAWMAMQDLLKSGASTREDPDALDYSEWNKLVNRVRGLVMMFQSLNANFIATALEAEDDNKIVPDLPSRKLRATIPAFFDVVGRLMVRAVPGPNGSALEKRSLVLRAGTKIVAKDRSDKFGTMPASIEDPTISKLLERMAEGQRQAIAHQKRESNG